MRNDYKGITGGLTAPYQETKLRPDQTTEEEDSNYLPTNSPILYMHVCSAEVVSASCCSDW
jgi:hypothetical protein